MANEELNGQLSEQSIKDISALLKLGTQAQTESSKHLTKVNDNINNLGGITLNCNKVLDKIKTNTDKTNDALSKYTNIQSQVYQRAESIKGNVVEVKSTNQKALDKLNKIDNNLNQNKEDTSKQQTNIINAINNNNKETTNKIGDVHQLIKEASDEIDKLNGNKDLVTIKDELKGVDNNINKYQDQSNQHYANLDKHLSETQNKIDNVADSITGLHDDTKSMDNKFDELVSNINTIGLQVSNLVNVDNQKEMKSVTDKKNENQNNDTSNDKNSKDEQKNSSNKQSL